MPPRKAKDPKPNAEPAPPDEPENLDTVRDILFGGHMRAVEGRIARIEERLVREQEVLRTDIQKSMGSLEAFTRKELEALADKLAAERAKRTEDLKALSVDIKESLKLLDRRLAQLDETTASADAELRSQMLEQQREAAADLKRLGDRLADELRTTEHTLRAEKADIASLLSIFSDVAVKLSEELQVPPDA